MLKINISALGTEHFAVFYPEKEFNEDEFMEEHSEDYMELADDNIDMEISSFNMECIINVNGTDIQIDDDFIEKSSVWRRRVGIALHFMYSVCEPIAL